MFNIVSITFKYKDTLGNNTTTNIKMTNTHGILQECTSYGGRCSSVCEHAKINQNSRIIDDSIPLVSHKHQLPQPTFSSRFK